MTKLILAGHDQSLRAVSCAAHVLRTGPRTVLEGHGTPEARATEGLERTLQENRATETTLPFDQVGDVTSNYLHGLFVHVGVA